MNLQNKLGHFTRNSQVAAPRDYYTRTIRCYRNHVISRRIWICEKNGVVFTSSCYSHPGCEKITPLLTWHATSGEHMFAGINLTDTMGAAGSISSGNRGGGRRAEIQHYIVWISHRVGIMVPDC